MRDIIAILRGIQPEEAIDVCSVLIEVGIQKIEVPLNSPKPFDSIEKMCNTFDGQALIGAGTVLSTQDVKRLANIGAQMVVSPDANSDVIKATKSHNMLSYPGVQTATECFSAIRAGADGLKIFPALTIGPEGLKALKAVLPKDMPVYAVGGAGPENFDMWIDAGAKGFGIGSALYKSGFTIEHIRQRATQIVAAYDNLNFD